MAFKLGVAPKSEWTGPVGHGRAVEPGGSHRQGGQMNEWANQSMNA